jgi:hypothetical protein
MGLLVGGCCVRALFVAAASVLASLAAWISRTAFYVALSCAPKDSLEVAAAGRLRLRLAALSAAASAFLGAAAHFAALWLIVAL